MLPFFKRNTSNPEKKAKIAPKPLDNYSKNELKNRLFFQLDGALNKIANLGKLTEEEIRGVVERSIEKNVKIPYSQRFPELLTDNNSVHDKLSNTSLEVTNLVKGLLDKTNPQYQEYENLRKIEKSPEVKTAQESWYYSLKQFAFREEDIHDAGGDLEDFYGTNVPVFETGEESEAAEKLKDTNAMKERMAEYGFSMCPLSEAAFSSALAARSIVLDKSYAHIVSTGEQKRTIFFEDPDTHSYYTKTVVFDVKNKRVYVVDEDE